MGLPKQQSRKSWVCPQGGSSSQFIKRGTNQKGIDPRPSRSSPKFINGRGKVRIRRRGDLPPAGATVFCTRSQTDSPAAPRGVARASTSRALELPSLLFLHGAERAALKVKPKHSSQATPAIPRERKRRESHGNNSFSWKNEYGYCLESSGEPPKENKKKN